MASASYRAAAVIFHLQLVSPISSFASVLTVSEPCTRTPPQRVTPIGGEEIPAIKEGLPLISKARHPLVTNCIAEARQSLWQPPETKCGLSRTQIQLPPSASLHCSVHVDFALFEAVLAFVQKRRVD